MRLTVACCMRRFRIEHTKAAPYSKNRDADSQAKRLLRAIGAEKVTFFFPAPRKQASRKHTRNTALLGRRGRPAASAAVKVGKRSGSSGGEHFFSSTGSVGQQSGHGASRGAARRPLALSAAAAESMTHTGSSSAAAFPFGSSEAR